MSLIRASGTVGHLEGKAEARQIRAGVIPRKGELWQSEVERSSLAALADRGMEVDELPARLAGGVQGEFSVTPAVEAAAIADVSVVIDQRVDVRGLAPAHALEVDAEERSRRTMRNVQRQCARQDRVCACVTALPSFTSIAWGDAQVVGRRQFQAQRARGLGALVRAWSIARSSQALSLLDPESQRDPVRSPLRILERLTGLRCTERQRLRMNPRRAILHHGRL